MYIQNADVAENDDDFVRLNLVMYNLSNIQICVRSLDAGDLLAAAGHGAAPRATSGSCF